MAPEVRLSGVENEPLGVVSLMEALRMAGELDVDLVEISATANPPVCRLMERMVSMVFVLHVRLVAVVVLMLDLLDGLQLLQNLIMQY